MDFISIHFNPASENKSLVSSLSTSIDLKKKDMTKKIKNLNLFLVIK